MQHEYMYLNSTISKSNVSRENNCITLVKYFRASGIILQSDRKLIHFFFHNLLFTR